MLVSVAIPAYNGADYLREAIESVLVQTYKPIEIIVVDDGSTDHTKQVCESFGSKVRYIYQENDGTKGAGARERAMQEAKGEWLALLDQDDRWMPTKIEKQLQSLLAHPPAAIAFTGFRQIDAQGCIIRSLPVGPSGEIFHTLLRGNPYCTSSGMFRRDILTHSGFPDIDVTAADYDLWLRITRNYSVVVVDECLTEYRIYEGNYSSDRRRLTLAVRQVLEKYRYRLHRECPECQRSFRDGWAAISKTAAHACLDQFHSTARAGNLYAALPFLSEAIKMFPQQALRPRQAAAVFKSIALASTFGLGRTRVLS